MLLEIKIEVCCELLCEAKRELCHGRMSGQNSLCVYCMMPYSPSGSLQTSTQPSAPAAASSSCKVSLTAVCPLPAAG